jgi:hypothetical protein
MCTLGMTSVWPPWIRERRDGHGEREPQAHDDKETGDRIAMGVNGG